MGHKRVKMELIKNLKTRMLTFRKRKLNLLKKASEFSILCNVSACVIIFPPEVHDRPVKPETWPSNSNDVISIIHRYKMSDHPKKSYHVSDYFAEKMKKVDSELAKLHKQVYQAKYPVWDDRLGNVPEDQLRLLIPQLEAKLEAVDRKLSMMKGSMYFMDRVGQRTQLVGSQLSQNFSYDMELLLKRSSNNLYSNNNQLISNLMPLDVQLGSLKLQPEQQSSQLSLLNQNSLESNDASSFGCYANLQVLPNVRPFNFQLPLSFQPKQEFTTTTWDNQNYAGSCFGVKTSYNSQFATRGGLPCANNSGSWMWDNAMSNDTYSSISNVSPLLQPYHSHQHFLPLGPSSQTYSSSQAIEFTADSELGGKDKSRNGLQDATFNFSSTKHRS